MSDQSDGWTDRLTQNVGELILGHDAVVDYVKGSLDGYHLREGLNEVITEEKTDDPYILRVRQSMTSRQFCESLDWAQLVDAAVGEGLL